MSMRLALGQASILCAFIAGLYRYRTLSKPDRLLVLLLALSVVTEAIAFATMTFRGNNMLVYNLYSPVEIIVIAFYFEKSVGFLYRLRVGIVTAVLAVSLTAFTGMYLQSLKEFNYCFLLFEDCIVVMLSLVSMAYVGMEEEKLPFAFAQFWISVCFIVYWSLTFSDWALFEYLNRLQYPTLYTMFTVVLAFSNYVFYIGLTVIFIRYPKLIPSGARA